MPEQKSSARPDFAPVPLTMDARKASSYVGLNLNALYRKTAAGEIRAVLWGKSARNLRWRKVDLDQWVDSLPLRSAPVRLKPVRREPEPAT